MLVCQTFASVSDGFLRVDAFQKEERNFSMLVFNGERVLFLNELESSPSPSRLTTSSSGAQIPSSKISKRSHFVLANLIKHL